MSKLLNARGEVIESKVEETALPSMEQILKDPITKKFIFLESKEFPEQTCIGLTDETKYSGVVYKYGKVTLPDESKLTQDKHLSLKFDYDILDTNGISKNILEGSEFHKLIGDILYHIIIAQSGDESIESDDRANNA